jgi:hypothetical protein
MAAWNIKHGRVRGGTSAEEDGAEHGWVLDHEQAVGGEHSHGLERAEPRKWPDLKQRSDNSQHIRNLAAQAETAASQPHRVRVTAAGALAGNRLCGACKHNDSTTSAKRLSDKRKVGMIRIRTGRRVGAANALVRAVAGEEQRLGLGAAI